LTRAVIAAFNRPVNNGQSKLTLGIVRPLILILFLLVGALASAQTNTFTFTNNSGVLYSNLILVTIEPSGVLFRFGQPGDSKYTLVAFTNMSTSLQAQFGYDPEKIRKANEARLAEQIAVEKAAQEAQIAAAREPLNLIL
jgi:hypothetical protein